MKQTIIWAMLSITLLAWLPSAEAGPSSNRIKQGPGLLDALIGDDQPAATDKAADTTADRPVDTQAAQLPSQTAKGEFDGIWHDGSRHVLLIKQIHRTLYLSGSSDNAAWQAQCVVSPAMARCLGNGRSATQGEFNYESDLHVVQGQLQIGWQRHYSNGRSDSGKSSMKR